MEIKNSPVVKRAINDNSSQINPYILYAYLPFTQFEYHFILRSIENFIEISSVTPSRRRYYLYCNCNCKCSRNQVRHFNWHNKNAKVRALLQFALFISRQTSKLLQFKKGQSFLNTCLLGTAVKCTKQVGWSATHRNCRALIKPNFAATAPPAILLKRGQSQ